MYLLIPLVVTEKWKTVEKRRLILCYAHPLPKGKINPFFRKLSYKPDIHRKPGIIHVNPQRKSDNRGYHFPGFYIGSLCRCDLLGQDIDGGAYGFILLDGFLDLIAAVDDSGMILFIKGHGDLLQRKLGQLPA